MKQTLALVTGLLLLGGVGMARAGDLLQPLQLSALQLDGITAGGGSGLTDYLKWCRDNKKNPKSEGTHTAYALATAIATGSNTSTTTYTDAATWPNTKWYSGGSSSTSESSACTGSICN